MKTKNWTLGGAALGLAALLTLAPTPPITQKAQAATMVLCQPDIAGGVQGSRIVINTSSTTTPQPQYVLNGVGCAVINQADVGFFLSQGFTQASSQNSILFTTGVATGTTDFPIGVLPANAYIQQIVVTNSTANAVTGGIAIGSTANGTDIVASITCGANCVSSSPGTNTLVKAAFSTTAATTLHAAAVTAWANANVTITVVYGYF